MLCNLDDDVTLFILANSLGLILLCRPRAVATCIHRDRQTSVSKIKTILIGRNGNKWSKLNESF